MIDVKTGLQKQRYLLIAVTASLVLSAVFSQVVDPMLASYFRIQRVYFFVIFNMVSLGMFVFIPGCNPFAWSRALIEEKQNHPRYKLHKGIAIGLFLIVISLKTMLSHWVNGLDGFQPLHLNFPIDIFVFAIGAVSEEVLYKAGLLRMGFEIGMPRIVSMCIVSIVFAVMHFIFIPGYLFSVFIIQMFLMGLFSLYPSIEFTSIVHFAWNISIFA